MDGMLQRYLKISVTFERREDGGLRVYSDDVPGLMLSGADPLAVFSDVLPALNFLFEHNRNMKVDFGPVVNDMRAGLEAQGCIPPSGHVVCEYVAPVHQAA